MIGTDGSRIGVVIAVGCAVALLVFLGVAPLDCEPNGICHGLVAFDYGSDSRGLWQALIAGAVLGTGAGILLWAVLAEGTANRLMRVALTPVLVIGIVVCLLSQSVLFFAGPVIGGLVLWRLWRTGGQGSR